MLKSQCTILLFFWNSRIRKLKWEYSNQISREIHLFRVSPIFRWVAPYTWKSMAQCPITLRIFYAACIRLEVRTQGMRSTLLPASRVYCQNGSSILNSVYHSNKYKYFPLMKTISHLLDLLCSFLECYLILTCMHTPIYLCIPTLWHFLNLHKHF